MLSVPDIKVMVHPECKMDVVDLADVAGSTSKIIREIDESPPGTRWAIGTEPQLVNRLRREHPEQEIRLLSNTARICMTMYRINLPRLCWALENLAAGTPVNVVEGRAGNCPLGTRGLAADAESSGLTLDGRNGDNCNRLLSPKETPP